MKVKINERLICIPPYISTTWDQVSFLQTEEEENKNFTLFLHLSNGKVVSIPSLDSSIVDIAFSAHMRFLESASLREGQSKPAGMIQTILGISPEQISSIPFKIGMGNLDSLETAFQHNPSQSNAPTLPTEVVDKIATLAKTISNGDLSGFPKPEPHCNCMHCQVARAIHNPEEAPPLEVEEPITDEDLRFRNWEIRQIGENLYTATNPLDPREQYNVYLGSPVGCTCGQPHCEHIKAVLST